MRTAAVRTLYMVLLLVLGCKRREPVQWLGIDRTAVSCARTAILSSALTCIGAGREYNCLSDDGEWTWRCAEVHAVTSRAEEQ